MPSEVLTQEERQAAFETMVWLELSKECAGCQEWRPIRAFGGYGEPLCTACRETARAAA